MGNAGSYSDNPNKDPNHIFEHPPFDTALDDSYTKKQTKTNQNLSEPTFHLGHTAPTYLKKLSMTKAISENEDADKPVPQPMYDSKAISYSSSNSAFVDIEKYLWLIFPAVGILIFTFVDQHNSLLHGPNSNLYLGALIFATAFSYYRFNYKKEYIE